MRNQIITFILFISLYIVLTFGFYGMYSYFGEANKNTFLYSSLISIGVVVFPFLRYVLTLFKK